MKIKTAYVYGAVAILVALFFILFTPSETKKGDLPGNGASEVPNDEAHKGLQSPGSPSGSNVSPSVIEKMTELKTAADKTPPDTAAIKEYADFLAMAHKPDEAVSYYEKLLKLDRKRTDVRFELAYIYYTRGEYGKAEKLTEDILAYDKNNAQAK
ncbi:MAG TPA: tetratricopeptide repeat protein, partial [Ignavibacteriales bacterium]|nr:tetratricopeptide repeat protein [Ignavibacteriales bacterium]